MKRRKLNNAQVLTVLIAIEYFKLELKRRKVKESVVATRAVLIQIHLWTSFINNEQLLGRIK